MPTHKYNTRLTKKRQQHPLSHDVRKRIARIHDLDNKNAKEIYAILKSAQEVVTYRTIARFIQEYKKTGNIEPQTKGGAHLDQVTPDILCKRIKE